MRSSSVLVVEREAAGNQGALAVNLSGWSAHVAHGRFMVSTGPTPLGADAPVISTIRVSTDVHANVQGSVDVVCGERV